MLLGADRTGKSTLIENTIKSFPEWVYGKSWHFTAPKIKTNPMQQYEDFLKLPFEDRGVDYVFMDRGFPETVFYEEYRCGNKIPMSEMIRMHNLFEARFNIFVPTIIYRSWNEILPGHLEEIANGINHDESRESPNLDDRRAEYEAYYEFMDKYVGMFPVSVNVLINPKIDQLLVPREKHI